MNLRTLLMTATVWLMLCSSAQAGGGSRTDYIDKYHCAVTATLQGLMKKGKKHPRDRYVILNQQHHLDAYVQCLFEDDSSAILCEAASGYFSSKPGTPRTFTVSADNRAKLAALGFSLDDSAGNFQQEIKLGSSAALLDVARLMFGTLYDVYGGNLRATLEVNAPLAPLRRATLMSCTPIS